MGLKTSMLLLMGGTVMQMRGVQEQADVAVATARHEAGVFRAEATARRRLSAEEQKLMRENLRTTLKRQRALVAKSGTTMRGAPMQIQLRTIEDMASDIGRLAFMRETEVRGFEQRAALSLMEAKFARKAGKLQKGQALFGGVTRIALLGLQHKLATQTKVEKI